MEISDLEFFLVEIDLVGPGGPVRSLLVRLASDSGEEGWGESQTGWRPSELEARRQQLLPTLVGRCVFDIEELLTLEPLDTGQIRCALEMACWDLIGRALGQPLCHLLGGCYRQRVPLAACLPAAVELSGPVARQCIERGIRTQVIRSCGQVEGDLQRISAIRQAVGESVRLRLDAAGQYDFQSARDLTAALEYEAVELLVDPLPGADFHALASLGRQTSVPLAVGRSIRCPADVLRALRCGACQAVVIGLGEAGGIVPARKCAIVADAGAVAAVLGGGPALGIGQSAVLHLAAATPALANPNPSGYHQLRDDVLAEPLEIVDGMIAVPQAPGLGVEVDRAKIEQYQVS